MVGRKQLIEFVCPVCDAGFGALPERAGQETTCNFCHTSFPIPVGLQPKLVSVSTGPSQPLTPEEEAMVRRELGQRRAKPGLPARMQPQGRQQLVVPEVLDDDFGGALVAPEPPRPVPANGIPPKSKFRMRLPKRFGEFEADVTPDTADKLSFVTVGGFLVGLGVFIAAMLGIKKRS